MSGPVTPGQVCSSNICYGKIIRLFECLMREEINLLICFLFAILDQFYLFRDWFWNVCWIRSCFWLL